MLKDRLVQSPHCPHGGAEEGKDLDSGELDKMVNSPASLTTTKAQSVSCQGKGRLSQVPVGWHVDQPAGPGPGWVEGGAGWPEHLVRGLDPAQRKLPGPSQRAEAGPCP